MITSLDLSLGLLTILRGVHTPDVIELISDTKELDSSTFRAVRPCHLFQSEILYWFLSGGDVGKTIENMMYRKGLNFFSTAIRDESAQHYLFEGGNVRTYFRGILPRITQDEANTFVNRIFLERNDDHIMLFMPDSRHRLPERMMINVLKALKSSNKRHVIFAEETQLKGIMEEGAHFLVTEQSSIEELYKVIFEEDAQIVNAVTSYFKLKAEHVIVTQGKKGFLYINRDRSYKVQSVQNMNIHALDAHSLCAGLCSGMDCGYDIEKTLKLAFAFYETASTEAEETATLEDLKKSYDKVEIVRLKNQ